MRSGRDAAREALPDRPRPARAGVRPATRVVAAVLVAAAVSLGGCKSGTKWLEGQYAAAAASPAGVSAALRKAFYEKTVTANAAIDLAHDRVEKAGDASSVAFARAVLDFTDQVEPDLEKAGVNEFFWVRLGTLAGSAAAAARKSGDLAGARAVVLAGPSRWRNEAYWRQHPAHDALASLVLHESGESDEALGRLRERGDLAEEVEQAKRKIEEDVKRRPRPRR